MVLRMMELAFDANFLVSFQLRQFFFTRNVDPILHPDVQYLILKMRLCIGHVIYYKKKQVYEIVSPNP